MKQKMGGRKVQNWHRPLGADQLRRWFRRHRHDDVPADDDCWSPYFGDDDWYPEGEDTDLHTFELKQLLREVMHRPEPLFRLEWAIDAALCAEAEHTVTEPEHPGRRRAGQQPHPGVELLDLFVEFVRFSR